MRALEKSINEILEHELTLFIDYERYDRSNNEDYRNGSYIRTFNTKYGVLNIKMPRDRLGLFYSSLLPKYWQTIIDLFDKGLPNQDISSIVNHLYGASYSKQTVSNITDKCIENIDKFKSRQLSKEYAVCLCGCNMHGLTKRYMLQKKQCI